jgi:hypothetical protein
MHAASFAASRASTNLAPVFFLEKVVTTML